MTQITLETIGQFLGLIVAMIAVYKFGVYIFGVNSRKIKKMQEELNQASAKCKQFEQKIIELEDKDELLQSDIKTLESDYKEIFKILLDRR